ncbi:hypothetical protein PPERSA_11989 [Pseudocohnilembus persalinus]|uniref:Uncharacterized protein n=1 Tax=Pseudocohnilembus persalinus TaxID=266149 RepID=A0A0V0QK25_PSEPJ|nr:hypothetical protein PPERSA_11989 [Pseudocohnilembus persalinus]|eukprot:KRX02649.1 hypothetical protein PPERSA_11989 [Pseudocohnilembus persalinus]
MLKNSQQQDAFPSIENMAKQIKDNKFNLIRNQSEKLNNFQKQNSLNVTKNSSFNRSTNFLSSQQLKGESQKSIYENLKPQNSIEEINQNFNKIIAQSQNFCKEMIPSLKNINKLYNSEKKSYKQLYKMVGNKKQKSELFLHKKEEIYRKIYPQMFIKREESNDFNEFIGYKHYEEQQPYKLYDFNEIVQYRFLYSQQRELLENIEINYQEKQKKLLQEKDEQIKIRQKQLQMERDNQEDEQQNANLYTDSENCSIENNKQDSNITNKQNEVNNLSDKDIKLEENQLQNKYYNINNQNNEGKDQQKNIDNQSISQNCNFQDQIVENQKINKQLKIEELDCEVQLEDNSLIDQDNKDNPDFEDQNFKNIDQNIQDNSGNDNNDKEDTPKSQDQNQNDIKQQINEQENEQINEQNNETNNELLNNNKIDLKILETQKNIYEDPQYSKLHREEQIRKAIYKNQPNFGTLVFSLGKGSQTSKNQSQNDSIGKLKR